MRLRWCLTALATMLLAGSSANASLVVDDFLPAAFVIGTGSDSYTLVADIDGTADISLANGGLVSSYNTEDGDRAITATLMSTSAVPQLTFVYTVDPSEDPLDLHSSGAFSGSPLVLDLFEDVVGTFNLDVTYEGDAGTASVNGIAISGPGLIGIDGADFGNAAVASAVKKITLEFRATNLETVGSDTYAQFTSTSASISAVPEPTTLALLAPMAIGGVFYRRRRNKADADKEAATLA